MASIDDPVGAPPDPEPLTEFRPLVDLLVRVWRDVNGRVWERGSDDWAKVLRTFRSKKANYYSYRLSWFHSALWTVLNASAVARGPDMQLIRLIRGLDVAGLSRLAEAMQQGLSSSVVGPLNDEQVQAKVELNKDLALFAGDLRGLVDRYRALLERLRNAHSEALWSGLYDDDTEDAEWLHFAYELRKLGFEPAEIAPLVDALPQGTALNGEPLRRRDLTRKARNRIRSQIDRAFARTGERKPLPGWGARGSRADGCAVVSIRACSDADDDDADRTHASGGSEGRVPLAPRNP